MKLDNCLLHFRAVFGFDIDEELIPRLEKALENGITEGDIIAAIDYVVSREEDVNNAGMETVEALVRLYKRRNSHIRNRGF